MTDLRYSALSIRAAEVLGPTVTAIPASRKAAKPSAVNSGIRICDAADDPFHLGGNQSIAAGRSAFAASSMTTGFQINVDSCASRSMASFFEGQHLGVFDSFIAVKALANNDAILHNDGADERVRPHLTFTFGGKCKSEIKKIQIELSATC